MKKFFLSFMLILSFFALSACENSTNLRCATIREISAAGSDNYGITVSFQDDKRLEEKAVDVQIRANKACELTFWEEGKEKVVLNLGEKEYWYSLTSLAVTASGKPETEKFMPFKDAISKTYLFKSTLPVELTFRVVAGDVETNASEKGEVLVGSEDISKEFNLKIK